MNAESSAGGETPWSRTERLFLEARAMSPAQRAEFLDRACAGDPALRRAVLALLDGDSRADGFLDRPALGDGFRLADVASGAEAPAPLDEPDPIGQQIGPYRVLRRLGAGGMGVVYLAERADDVFRKQVALKIIKRGMESAEILRRFRNERQLLAHLEHPGIARLIDGGALDDGRPWLAMEFVDGTPIHEYCDHHTLDTRRRLELFCLVCDAVEAAHRNLVVHRDLKPNNILITADGAAKLLDFGIAKTLAADAGPTAANVTAAGAQVMTPRYASPEQVRGAPITTAADVYSLGVILYELLTGHHPYTIRSGTRAEYERAIVDEAPRKPSTVVTHTENIPATGDTPAITVTPQSVAATREADPHRLRSRLSGDLDAIVLMALRKEPARRYASVSQFRDDIRRCLAGLPVTARPDSLRYRTAKFVRRNALAVSAATILAVTLIIATIVSSSLYVQADKARDVAESARRESDAQRALAQRFSAYLKDMLTSIDPLRARGQDTTLLREVLEAASVRFDRELADEPAVAADLHHTIGTTFHRIALYDKAEQHLRRALEMSQRAHDGPHPQTADSLLLLSQILQDRSTFEEAESTAQDALDMQRAMYGTDHPKTAAAFNRLGSVLEARGRDGEAESAYRAALDIHRRASDPDFEGLAAAAGNLGAFLIHKDHAQEECVALLRETVDIRRRNADENPLQLSTALHNLAGLLRRNEDYDESEALYLESLDLLRANMPPGHPAIAVTMNNLASTYEHAGDLARAEPLYREALAIERVVHGDRHRDVGTTTNNLAGLLRKAQRYDEAEPLYHEAIAIYRETLGPDHAWVGIVLGSLAALYEARGDCAAAAPVIDECLRVRRQHWPDEHWRITAVESLRAACLVGAGEYDDAERILLRCIDLLDPGSPQQKTFRDDSIVRLIRLYELTDRPDDAAPWRVQISPSR